MKYLPLAAMVAALTLSACQQRQAPTLTLPGQGPQQTSRLVYHCDDGTQLSVTYYNNDLNRLAVVAIPGQGEVVMANVIAASGAKYDGNAFEWWTKGNSGTFSRLMDDKHTECKI
ncbi:lysozyme inhibitor [Paramixta manurensis]|uniref:Lysozyme inhibitor n=1 Tax=Paramixta manurensis TaxID=2740817 RepID=A0A6M8UF13_9GAMM|nr:lysozyme inhibitor [Erwiniaceae bacterium PD-1]